MADKIVKGTIVYKQFNKYIPLEDMNGLQWFALENNYGESYGNIHKKYVFKKQPKLLDIGDGNIREMIEEQIKPYDDSIVEYSDPNEQYSGGKSNTKYHNIVKKYFRSEYDGTIIDEKNLKNGQKYSSEDMEGPSEIVLWKDFTELLEELPNGGKKRKLKLKNSSKKTKRKKIQKTKRQYFLY
jgi:hypothetical protein